ncbi:MAG: hypothetical protein FWF76_03635 [Oscillospiraceae bacterium]|nr:hypothetical protein [Oscillospiraceae bacterium]
MKQIHPKRGKKNASLNAITLGLVIAGLSVHFTLSRLWNAGTIIAIIMLTIIFSFYVWLWRSFYKK